MPPLNQDSGGALPPPLVAHLCTNISSLLFKHFLDNYLHANTCLCATETEYVISELCYIGTTVVVLNHAYRGASAIHDSTFLTFIWSEVFLLLRFLDFFKLNQTLKIIKIFKLWIFYSFLKGFDGYSCEWDMPLYKWPELGSGEISSTVPLFVFYSKVLFYQYKLIINIGSFYVNLNTENHTS